MIITQSALVPILASTNSTIVILPENLPEELIVIPYNVLIILALFLFIVYLLLTRSLFSLFRKFSLPQSLVYKTPLIIIVLIFTAIFTVVQIPYQWHRFVPYLSAIIISSLSAFVWAAVSSTCKYTSILKFKFNLLAWLNFSQATWFLIAWLLLNLRLRSNVLGPFSIVIASTLTALAIPFILFQHLTVGLRLKTLSSDCKTLQVNQVLRFSLFTFVFSLASLILFVSSLAILYTNTSVNLFYNKIFFYFLCGIFGITVLSWLFIYLSLLHSWITSPKLLK